MAKEKVVNKPAVGSPAAATIINNNNNNNNDTMAITVKIGE